MEANDGKTLGAIGIETRELFSVLTSASKKLPLTSPFFEPHELITQFEKFELWALNLGLNAPGHGSLDYRLRDWEVANDIVRRLLEDVRDALADIELLLSETSGDGHAQYGVVSSKAEADVVRSLDETNSSIASLLADELRALGYESEDETVNTLTEDLLMNRQKVSDALDRLYRIATKLRNPATRHISERISLFEHIDADTGVDLMISYAEYDQRHISELLSQRLVNTDNEREVSQAETESRKAEKPHFLVSRLAQGNTLRRKQFYQWRRHRLKLEYAVYSSSEVTEQRSTQVVRKSAALVLGAPSTIGYSSPTTATNLNVQTINWDEDRSIVSVSEYAANANALKEDLAYFPDPPRKKEGTRYFECPYCFTICPNAYLKTQDAWRNHIIRDLRPYMCTYKDCISGQELWATRADWMQHEDSCHRKVWRCLEHRNLTFETRKTYDDHLKHDHAGASEQLRTFELFRAGESSETEARRPCPFCGKDFRTVLESEHHIAMHLERIAAFTLPRSTGQEDESAVGSNWSVQAKNRAENQHSELESSTGNESFASIPRYPETVISSPRVSHDGEVGASQPSARLAFEVLEEHDRQNGPINLVDAFVRHRDDSMISADADSSSGREGVRFPFEDGPARLLEEDSPLEHASDAADIGSRDEDQIHPLPGILRSTAPTVPGQVPISLGTRDLLAENRVFGVSLEDLYQRDSTAVPLIVYQCVQAVDLFGLDTEDVYHTSGGAESIEKIKAMFNNDSRAVDLRNPASFNHDIANVTTVLKHFLRDLPDPLFTSASYTRFITAAKIHDDIVRRDSIHAEINALPDPNYATLRVLILHLERVAQHSSRNRMTPASLAICVGPISLRKAGGDVMDAGWQARVVETILNNTFQIFDDDSDEEEVGEGSTLGEAGSQSLATTSQRSWERSGLWEDNREMRPSAVKLSKEQAAKPKSSSRLRLFFSRRKKEPKSP